MGLHGADVAVFGQKDYQQLVLIRRMAADLCLGVDVVGAETVREPDGLALSSRNRYLDDEQRLYAQALSRTLRAAAEAASYGVAAALDAARAELRSSQGVDLDYLELRRPDLSPLADDVPSGTEAAVRGGDAVLEAARAELTDPGVELDYLVLTDPDLGPAPAAGPARLLVAARVGGTRLLDNIPVHLSSTPTAPSATSQEAI